jgi:RHS repeat-associated protein
MTDYFGGQTNYSYDALGRLTSLTNPFGEVTTFQYDADSRLIRKNLANGTYTTYSYNSRGFLTGIYNYKSNGTPLTYATYTYDAVGNRLSMSTPEGNYTYSYDAIYRLTGEVNPIGGTYSYTYDAVGNRLSMTHNGQTINYVYDAGNKLLQAGNATFTYDGNGNMVSKTENGQTTTYVYNYEDKMVQVNLPNGSIVYSYDHSGKRIAKTAGGTTINYYFDGDDLITEAQGANILAYYTQGQGLISQRRNNASYFYHYDGLGSTKALTDANQNIQNTTKYDAWGNILQASGTITNPYLYVGELGYYGDGDAGMYLLTQRWYNPLIGRFVVRDPVGIEDNFYVYCMDTPLNLVDPQGLQAQGLIPQPPPVCPSSPTGAHAWTETGPFQHCMFCGATRYNPFNYGECTAEIPIGDPANGGFTISICVKIGDTISWIGDYIKCLGGGGSWDPGKPSKRPVKPVRPKPTPNPPKPKPPKPKPPQPKPYLPPVSFPSYLPPFTPRPFPIYL